MIRPFQGKNPNHEKFFIPRSVQQSIPIKQVHQDGIFEVAGLYSKTWRFFDVNYAVAGPEKKEALFLSYCAFLNSLPVRALVKITLFNRTMNQQEFSRNILMQMVGDGKDRYRVEYNDILTDNAASSNNLTQEKYITISVERKNIEEARAFFDRVTADVVSRLNHLDSHCEELSAMDRLRVLHDFYRTGEESEYRLDLRDCMRKGHSFKDAICPDSLEFKKDHFIMGGKFGRVLAGIFSVLIILALGFMGNMVQSNSIGDAFSNAFGVPRIAVGVVVAAIAAFIFLGGVGRIASVTEKIVPIMAAFYIVGCIVILVMNAKALPATFAQIFVLAFDPQAMAGGVAGVTVQQAMRFGVARGLFSNEAGLGSTPHAHALAKVDKPQDQGAVAILGVFIDTFVVLTLTGLVLVSSGLVPQGLTGTALTQAAFSQSFGGFGPVFIAICMFFFAFSTIIGWYFFGHTNFKALFGEKALPVYSVIVVIFILVGSTLKVDLVWAMADFFNGLMAIPNLLALLALSGLVAAIDRGEKK